MSLPPSEIPLGAMRFNSDSHKLEYWNGESWFQIKTFSPTLDGGVRGVTMGGRTPGGNTNRVEFFTVDVASDATDFGDLTQARGGIAAASSTLRGLFAGGTRSAPATNSDVIDYVTIATTGNATDFGNLSAEVTVPTGLSDSHGGLG